MSRPSIVAESACDRAGRLHLALIVGAGLAGCRRQSPGDEQRYELKGKVVSVDLRGETVTIAHESIPGYMEAMAMPFKLKEKWAYQVLTQGDHLQATLVVSGERTWLEDLSIVRESPDPVGAQSTGFAEPKIGDEVPDFTLVNQDAKRIRVHQYRGRALVLTFIYTRCPLPDYCPLMTRRFIEVRQALMHNPSIADKTRLLMISVDPEYDKPGVLREYGRSVAGLDSFAQWSLPPAAPTRFGRSPPIRHAVLAGGRPGHSLLRTAIIGPDGKLVASHRGSEWSAEDLLEGLQQLNLD